MNVARHTLTALRDPASLVRRAAASAAWRLGNHGASLALRLGSNLIMTRLLEPEAFGLFGLVFAVHTGLIMMTDVGIRPAVIRSAEGGEPDFLRTAWTVQLLQHGLISAALLAVAFALLILQQNDVIVGESAYADPSLPGLLAASVAILLASGFQTANVGLAEREMALGRLIAVNLTAQAVSVGVMIGVALLHPSVWALAIGSIVGAALRCALGHMLLPGPRMALCLRRDVAAEIWTTGKWLIGASLFGFVANHGDRLILAALLDARTFGLYAIAGVWVGAARDGIAGVMRPTGFAVVSEVGRTEPDRIAQVFRHLRLVQDVFGAAACASVIVLGPELIRLLYPPAYAGAGMMMTILSFQILLQRYAVFQDLLLRAGDTLCIARAAFVGCVAMLVLPASSFIAFGAPWAVLAVALNGAFAAPALLSRGSRYVPVDLMRELLVLAAIVAAAVAYLAHNVTSL